MFQQSKRLFSLFGFEVKLDWSWLFLAMLVAWSLASGYFPYRYEGLSTATYWLMGIIGALGVFISIVFHEMSHSLVARKHGIPMKGITLFIFGGVAEMSDEPKSPNAEFFMAIAGPLSSILLGGIFYGLALASESMKLRTSIQGVFRWLMTINFILAGFNLLPAFPTDGGRVLRAILWKLKNNLRWATRIASGAGAVFGLVLMILGILNIVLVGNFVGGMWWFLIGMFLRGAARGSYQQLLMRKALEGETVRKFMKSDPITVTPDVRVSQLVNDYFYTHHYKMFPVVENGKIKGCVSVYDVKEVPKEKWEETTTDEIATKCTENNTISPNADAMKALSMMSQNGSSRLMVVEDGRLVGILSLKDLLKFLSIKFDLEDYKESPVQIR